MKLNGTLILILVVALAAFSGMAWTAAEEKPVCPHSGEPVACAGDGPHGPHGPAGPHHRPELMAAALDLDNEQREAMREILTSEREAVREQMETVLAGILTPEQLVKLDEIKARRESRGDMGRPERMGRKGLRGGEGMRGGDRGDRTARHLERMTEHLDLTPEQQDQIREILDEATPPPRAETREKIRAVLTPEQQEKMDQHRRQRPGRGEMEGEGRMRDRRGRGMELPQHLARRLDLTDEQRAAVREKMAQIRSERRDEIRSRIDALLTPEQREKLEQLHRNRPSPNR